MQKPRNKTSSLSHPFSAGGKAPLCAMPKVLNMPPFSSQKALLREGPLGATCHISAAHQICRRSDQLRLWPGGHRPVSFRSKNLRHSPFLVTHESISRWEITSHTGTAEPALKHSMHLGKLLSFYHSALAMTQW